MRLLRSVAALALLAAAGAGHAEDATSVARDFGARPWVESVALSPDGKHLVYVTPGAGQMNVAMVQDVQTGATKAITYADGKPLKIARCGWSANDRLVCLFFGISMVDHRRTPWNRIVAMDIDGTKPLDLGRLDKGGYWRIKGTDGSILDWLSGQDGTIVMNRLGLGQFTVERVDTRTGVGTPVKPITPGGGYLSDGKGAIRIVAIFGHNDAGYTGEDTYRYRLAGSDKWLPFSKVTRTSGLRPIAIDAASDIAYCLQKLNGRDALYKVALDGSLKTDLIFADPNVDVQGVETIGRNNRVIGYRYATDRIQIVYTDPVYKALVAKLSKALPQFPIIVAGTASTDERKVLIFAGSDVDPGHYFLLDRDSYKLTELLLERPQLQHRTLAAEKTITYPAADGTPILGYLLLPPGSSWRGLPAIVMPHGGPASRDVWGFDWLAQFFAARGYAVLQPEYRGSTGFGESFLGGSAFKTWRTSIGDVADAGRWLVTQGIADPAKLAIVGWSFGGYAALQVNYLDPNLFKAVIAVAPVTSAADVWSEYMGSTTRSFTTDTIGTHANSVEGSPVRHADAFKAPVLMFHGDLDLNVEVTASKSMDAALKAAGKQSRLVVFEGLDHQLDDSAARADMLKQSDEFLRKTLKLDAQ